MAYNLPSQAAPATVLGSTPFAEMGRSLVAEQKKEDDAKRDEMQKQFMSDLPNEIWMERDGGVFSNMLNQYMQMVSANPNATKGSSEWNKMVRARNDIMQFGNASKQAKAKFDKIEGFVQQNAPEDLENVEAVAEWAMPKDGKVSISESGNILVDGKYFADAFTDAPNVSKRNKQYSVMELYEDAPLMGKNVNSLGQYFKPTKEQAYETIKLRYMGSTDRKQMGYLMSYISGDYKAKTGATDEMAKVYTQRVMQDPDFLAQKQEEMLVKSADGYINRHDSSTRDMTPKGGGGGGNTNKNAFVPSTYTFESTNSDDKGLIGMSGVAIASGKIKLIPQDGTKATSYEVSNIFQKGGNIYITGYQRGNEKTATKRLYEGEEGLVAIDVYGNTGTPLNEATELTENEANRLLASLKGVASYRDILNEANVNNLDDFKDWLANQGEGKQTTVAVSEVAKPEKKASVNLPSNIEQYKGKDINKMTKEINPNTKKNFTILEARAIVDELKKQSN